LERPARAYLDAAAVADVSPELKTILWREL